MTMLMHGTAAFGLATSLYFTLRRWWRKRILAPLCGIGSVSMANLDSATIEGVVDTVVFQNKENGYTVLQLDAGEKGVTVVGIMPGAAVGESLSITGRWMTHPSYGEQFKAEQVERQPPSGEQAMFAFLASGAIKGLGLATAKRLMEEFGSDVLRVLEEEPERLSEVKGITKKRASQIADSYQYRLGMRALMDFLIHHSISVNLAMPLFRRYGSAALQIVKKNPYILLEEELGVDFALADKLAATLGVEAEDSRRIEAGLIFVLQYNLQNGHCFLPQEKLLAAAGGLLGCEFELLERGLELLVEHGEVVEDTVYKERACFLATYYEAEVYTAFRLMEMAERELHIDRDVDRVIAGIEQEQGIFYAPLQREAVETAARSQVMILTGGPGTGKTTSLRGVLALFEALGLRTALAAPTGRAAKRLGEACEADSFTIHRLLETQFGAGTGNLAFAKNEDDPLEYQAVIVDETSMVDLALMRALLCALPPDCRLILVGDPDQLPSVGAGSVFSDLVRCGRLPVVRLDEIFRQAQDSGIVMNAHAVNKGSTPDMQNRSKDFFFLKRFDSQSTLETIVDLCGNRLPNNMGISSEQIQVLSPTRKHTTGTASLNRALQQALNPAAEEKGERSFGDIIFRIGDRVMQVKNNYDLIWVNGSETGIGVYNGDIGTITAIERRSDQLTVDFDGRRVNYTGEMLIELEPAYAVTVHKSQGSEYRAVVLACMDGAPMLMARNLLYTAITRARELLILVGSEETVTRMAANDRQQKRYSGLRYRLKNWE